MPTPLMDQEMSIDEVNNRFETILFHNNLREINPPGTTETIFDSKDVTPEQLREAFTGIGRIAILGWSSQGPAHAQNMRESLDKAGMTDVELVVGLRAEGNPDSRKAAEEAGFTVVEAEEAAATSDIVSMLISDSGQVDDAERYINAMKTGSTLLFAHGFYFGWREQAGLPALRNDIDIIGVCPKGMGPSVREMYKIDSGINSSFAVEQNHSGRALDKALAYSAMIGSPHTFMTTLDREWRSDLFGERNALLAGVHGLIEGLAAEQLARNGGDVETAYIEIVQSIVGPINDRILNHGFVGLMEGMSEEDQKMFALAYESSYAGYSAIGTKLYDEVSSGREIARVVEDNKNNKEFADISSGDLWTTTATIRDNERKNGYPYKYINPVAAGMYVAMMVAQVDELRRRGHHWSEVVNESIIEAVASLNPYMKSGGIDYMVDNCSVTARRGDREHYEDFQQATQNAYAIMEMAQELERVDDAVDNVVDLADFKARKQHAAMLNHPIHNALSMFDAFRPVDSEGNVLAISVEVNPEKLAAWREKKRAQNNAANKVA